MSVGIDAEDFPVGQELKREIRSCWNGALTRSPQDKRSDALESSIDAGIGPLKCVSRVMEAGGRVEHRPPCGDRICGRELTSHNPIGDYATNPHLCARPGDLRMNCLPVQDRVSQS